MSVDEYKNKFPFGLEEFAKGLSTPTSVAIASLLYEKGSLSEQEIREYLPDANVVLKSNLRLMSNNGIIARTETTRDGETLKSKYKLNKIYVRLIESCVDILKLRGGKK